MSTITQQQYTFYSNPQTGAAPGTLTAFVDNFKHNFLTKPINIVPGLAHSQYETVKRTYFYIHNQFESGPFDENGDPKYFYDLITHRNDQATKNIDINTKDVYIKSETEGSLTKTWLLRREFVGYAKTSKFGSKLNGVADDLPDFGTVVWKRVKLKDGRTDVRQVELINLMNDPYAECLKDGIVIERHNQTQEELRSRKSYNQTVVEELIKGGAGTVKASYMDAQSVLAHGASQVDTTTPFYETYELWGEIPRWMYEKYKTGGLPRVTNGAATEFKKEALTFYKEGESKIGVHTSEPQKETPYIFDNRLEKGSVRSASYNTNETVYVMAVIAGLAQGQKESVLFCKEVDRDMFPYKEVHFRRKKGRWLGVGNYESCFPLIEQANELTNRFFSSLRLALSHVFQTRDKLHVKNLISDILDGDVVVSKSEISIIPTEVRGVGEFREMMSRIESQADKICNSFEVVTGENMPSGTPFKLGAQQLKSATKLFDYVRQNIGLFIEDVFNEWLLPDFAASLSEEHILELMDDADDIDIYYNAQRKILQYEVLKQYILENESYPDPQQLSLVGSLVKDQIKKGPKQVRVLKNYYADLKYKVKVIITDENDAKKENLETISTMVQVAMANPQGLQDPRLMKLVNIVLEQAGYSPLEINAVNETPTNPLLNPANQGGGGAEKVVSPGAAAREQEMAAGAR